MTTRMAPERATPISTGILAALAWRIGRVALRRLQVGGLTVVLADGSRHEFGDPAAPDQGEIRFDDSAALVRMLLGGETGAGEAYMDGRWSSPDLAALIRVAALNREALALSSGWFRRPLQLRRVVAHRLRRNTKAQARRNIAAHYDLGNDFYRLFLDETLTYSSAVFETPEQSLADAQRSKYRRIAEGAGLSPANAAGKQVLEIGSGWGGFALYAARELGCRVTSITISKEQHDLARERVRAAGLEHLVEIELRDYREINGTYDAIVSIEMLEAVGAKYFETFFEACDRALRPGGRLSLQSITFPDVAYETQRQGANWIQTYIFPGGLCPSLAVIERASRNTRLLIRSVADIGPDYVRTLREWRTRFMTHLDDVREQGFDERFIRMWEYYLALSEAGFATGICQDLQIAFEKRRGIA